MQKGPSFYIEFEMKSQNGKKESIILLDGRKQRIQREIFDVLKGGIGSPVYFFFSLHFCFFVFELKIAISPQI